MAVPTITSVHSSNDGTRIRVVFSEAIQLVSGTLLAALRFTDARADPSVDLTKDSATLINSGTTIEYAVSPALLPAVDYPDGDEGVSWTYDAVNVLASAADAADVVAAASGFVTNNRTTINRVIDRVPIATGDAVLFNNTDNRAYAVWDEADIPDLGDDFAFLLHFDQNANTAAFHFGARTDNNNRISFRRYEAANSAQFQFDVLQLGTTARGTFTTKAEFTGGGRWRGVFRVLLRLRNVGGVRRWQLCVIQSDGTVYRDDATNTVFSAATFNWGWVKGLASGFMVGTGQTTSTTFQPCPDGIGTLMAFGIPGASMQTALDDDAVVRRLLEDPTTLQDIDGVDMDKVWCPLGNVVTSEGVAVDRTTWTNVSTAHHLECPYNPGARTPMVIQAGTPQWQPPFSNPADRGGYAVQPDSGTQITPLSNVAIRSVIWAHTNNETVEHAWQRISLTTGQPLSPPVPVQYFRRNSAGDLLPGQINPITDTHNAMNPYRPASDPHSIYFLVGTHHGEDSGYREVLNVIQINDQNLSGINHIPDPGVAFGSAWTNSYNHGNVSGHHAVFATSMASAFARQQAAYLHDMRWDDIDFRFITAAGVSNDGDRAYAPNARGVQFVDADRFVIYYEARANTDTSQFNFNGMRAVIGSISGWSDNGQWFAGHTGEPLDGSGANSLTMGSIPVDADAVLLYRGNSGVAVADQDVWTTRLGMWFDGTIAGAAATVVPDNVDDLNPDPQRDFRIVGWNLVPEGSGSKLTQTVDYSVQSVVADVLDVGENSSAARIHAVKGTGKQLMLLVGSKDGVTFNATTNAIFDADSWVSKIAAVGTGDWTTDADGWLTISDSVFDPTGTVAIRPHHTTFGGAPIGERAAVQIVRGGPNISTAGGGDADIVLFDIASALAGIPVLAAGGPQRNNIYIGIGL